ncbi:MAG: immune inhibitor A [Chloroflexota bacterium]|nr:immune inhibitor A [Chloroflexota bacterium]
MQAQVHSGEALRRGRVALALIAAALVAAIAPACESEPDQPPSPAAIASPTAVPAPTAAPPANPAPNLSGTPAPAATPAPAEPLQRPSLSPTEMNAGTAFPARIHPPPPADFLALAERFRPGQDARLAVAPVLTAGDVGRSEPFWIVDLIRLRVDQVPATLHFVTPNALWYVAEGVDPQRGRLEQLAQLYEDRVFPTVARATLGFVPGEAKAPSEPPVSMVITPLSGAAGYFASSDYYTPAVFPYSNGRPALYLDSRVIRTGRAGFSSLTGHELQHLLHQLVDPDEHTWVNEGISEVAAGLVSPQRPVTPPGFREEISLTNWPGYGQGISRYYNTAYLFFVYFTQRYGLDSLAPLIARAEDGAAGIDAYLREAGHPQTFERLFMDWSVANLIGAEAPMPYGYADASHLVKVDPRRTVWADAPFRDDVAPFAADVLRLDVPEGGATLTFEGDPTASILDTAPLSGEACWWSNRGDASHSRLTHEFDLSAVTEATLTFRMWHNLEEKWDYLYVTATPDGGKTWHVLPGAHTVTDDPIGATYGPGFTGHSGGWVEERVDLTPFAGAPVHVSFEQVFDAAISLDGACIDDIAVPEIGFFDDAETDGAWSADGFVRTNNALPQRFGVRVVIERPRGAPTVLDVPLDDANAGSLNVPALAEDETVAVIVASLTPHTRQSAGYELLLTAAPA